jgi:signal peptidase I
MDNQVSQTPSSSAPVPASVVGAQSKWSRRAGAATRSTAATIFPAIAIALLIHLFLAQATRVYGQSMEPGIHENQRLVIEKISYHLRGPQRGDVVVLRDPSGTDELLIKRVVGLPGERVTVADGKVFIDGTALNEPYLAQLTLGPDRSWVVPPFEVFVMGDNRGASRDSRSFGPAPLDDLVGHAVFRYWPLAQFGLVR